MTSRRPMTRSFSGNGRTSSFSEEEGSSSNGRQESRNTYLSNVRPENRSTLCSVMAQLTEDIQPSFETTLKSKAVSENCNVKFACVVSGYPAPELKWYKDDMQMDRYCGLPKYEIRRNGKTHTLHIYNCTLDDAAIYQVSASNSKGIVSCSGVLEVGTMNEYKIHQRFFDKLKQKAEKKKHEMEVQNRKEEKVIPTEKLHSSPERPPRKRAIPASEERPAIKKQEAVEEPGAAMEANGVSSEVKETTPVTSKDLEKETEKSLVKKKIKISNGVDVPVNSSNSTSSSSRSHMMGNGGENCYDGGISLAQFLAETLQSQTGEEKQNSPRGERHKEMDVSVGASIERDREQERMQKENEEKDKGLMEDCERERRKEEEEEEEEEGERERQPHTVPYTKHGSDVKHHSKGHKDHDHHKIQASISSMFHSVKDFLFGKGKRDSHGNIENTEREFDHLPPPPETPPSFRLRAEHNQVCKPLTEDTLLMDICKPKEPPETVSLGQLEHKHEANAPHTELPPPESVEESTGLRVKGTDDAEAMEVSVRPEFSRPVAKKSLPGIQVHSEAGPTLQQQPESPEVSQLPNPPAAMDDSSLREDVSVMPNIQASNEEQSSPTFTSLEETLPPSTVILSSDRHSLGEVPTETVQEKGVGVDHMDKKGEPDTYEGCSSTRLYEEEKAEVKLNQPPCTDVNRSEISELTASSLEERIEPYEPKTSDQVPPPQCAVTAYSEERDNVKEETEHASLIQEMNVGYPPNVSTESQEKGGLEKKQEYPCPVQKESTGVLNISAIQSSDSGFGGSEESPPTLEREGLCNNLKAQEQAMLEGGRTEESSERLPFEVRTGQRKETEVDESEELNNLSVTQNKEGSVNVGKEHSDVVHQDGSKRQQGWPPESIPQILLSTIEDTPDTKRSVPYKNPTQVVIIPKIEVMEPELKEPTLPLTILTLNKLESEPPASLQNHDTAHESDETIQNKRATDSPSLLPTQKGMQNDYDLLTTGKVKEVAQLDDEAEMFERKQPPETSSEQLPQMVLASIPVINVLCTDDKEDEVYVNSHVSDTQQPFETPTVPLFVVPPISVTCYESDSVLTQPTQIEQTLTETLTVMQRGTENHVGNNSTTTNPDRSQSGRCGLKELANNSVEEKIPPLPYEAQTPKVGDSKTAEDNIVPEISKAKPLKEAKTENSVSLEDLQRNKPSAERLCSKPPTYPSLSPASLRKFMSKAALDTDSVSISTSDRQSDKAEEDVSGGSTPTSSLSCESSPRLKRRDSLSLIRSATPEELASGARRKIFMPKPKEEGEGVSVGALDTQGKKETPYMSPSQARRAALLQAPTGQNTPPMEKRSPLLSRRKITLEVPKVVEETPTQEQISTKQEEKPEKKLDPLKAPQVIRKIRGEPFPDASGHLKLWCQFFNVLSDSTIKWFRDEEEILEVKRSGGDESQVALAIVLASNEDCGVYGCSIKNEYGSDTTDFLLSEDILSEILLKDDLEVGEEIEMTPMVFTRGLADCGNWGDKYFGRIMTEAANVGEGCAHKASKVKVIYGLDPIYESGSACIIKVHNPIAYGTKQENNLAERNLEITKHECKVQNMIREYCKIFAAEARVTENFGSSFEVVPRYLMYRPANSVPYATVEVDLKGDFQKYCSIDSKNKLTTQTSSEVEQKCSTFQHWIHQWTHGNLLVTGMEGVETKITNVRVVTKSKGYQGLTENGSPEVFEQFLTHHQCNYYCGLLGLQPLKSMDSLQQPNKTKGSRSPLLNRKLGNSPQLQRKGHSPQLLRKANSSPKVSKKVLETEDNKSGNKPKLAETADALEMR